MKVLHLLSSDRYSGAENVACQIIDMFRDDETVEMVYCSPDGQIREALAERDVTYAPISRVCVKEVKRVIREYQPDLVHAHDIRAGVIAALSCGRVPMISHVHNNDFRGLSVKAMAYWIAAKKAKHIFWVSQSAYSGYMFRGLFKKKSSVLYNVIDEERLYEKMRSDSNEYTYDVVYVGRLTYQKNPQRLMRVLRMLADEIPSVRVGIIGTGDLAEEAQQLCRDLALEQNVQFLGFQSNPLKMMHCAKAMLMTSRYEGTPMCALEAIALGLPIVSTPVDGLKDVILTGETGYLSDDDEVLAGHLSDILRDTELHARLSDGAKALSSKINDKNTYKEKIQKVIRL